MAYVTRKPLSLRIYGDNIIECERAVRLISEAFNGTYSYVDSPLFVPIFRISNDDICIDVELFPGYGRWSVNIQELLIKNGSPLREATDVLVTRIENQTEELLFAVEYCSALPAGNQAWQRSGRALACVTAGVPYLYITEIGGVELDKSREVKASRFPNPIVPFSYLTATKLYSVLCLPVFLSSPSCSQQMKADFSEVFGEKEGHNLIKALIEKIPTDTFVEILVKKVLRMTELLANNRKRSDTLKAQEWATVLSLNNSARINWLIKKSAKWGKKRSAKVQSTATFLKLTLLFSESNRGNFLSPVSIGADDIPICLLAPDSRVQLSSMLNNLYGDLLPDDFYQWVNKKQPLIIVWVTGFKPEGDDSRPDRGLAPLTRMLFGEEVDVLTIINGPAKPSTWSVVKNSLDLAIKQNGLLESVINLSDGVLVDSTTTESPFGFLTNRPHRHPTNPITFTATKPVPLTFTEQDVDCITHMLFNQNDGESFFEALCNPPGGDWSGISIYDFENKLENRWTSLPRVSEEGGKRPDHVIQLNETPMILFSIESKDRGQKLSHNIGERLIYYVEQLTTTPPNTIREKGGEWIASTGENRVTLGNHKVLSGGAFCWINSKDLIRAMDESDLDFVFGFEFNPDTGTTTLHAKIGENAAVLPGILRKFSDRFGSRLEIQIH